MFDVRLTAKHLAPGSTETGHVVDECSLHKLLEEDRRTTH